MPHERSDAYREAEEKIERARRSGAKELFLCSTGLTEVPESLGKLTALQGLSIFNNQLTTLPEALGKLTALQTLDLQYNQLTTLPEALVKLTALQRLVLFNNRLTTLPESLGQLAALQWLDLANKISDRGGVKITRRVRLAPCRERFDGRARTVL